MANKNNGKDPENSTRGFSQATRRVALGFEEILRQAADKIRVIGEWELRFSQAAMPGRRDPEEPEGSGV